jgi:hypothetical protein
MESIMNSTKLVVLILLVLQALDAWASGSKIVFDHEVKDFGKVPYGEKLTERFPFTNAGDDLLIIQNVRADCGCTKTLSGNRKIVPGGHSEIVATFDTSGLGPGPKERHIYVRSNDSQRSSIKLILLADVVRELTVTPSTLVLKFKPSTQSLPVDLQIANASDRPVAITGVKVPEPKVQAVMEKENLVVCPGCTTPCRLEMSLSQDNRRPLIGGRLILETDHVREKALVIRYLIELVKPGTGTP